MSKPILGQVSFQSFSVTVIASGDGDCPNGSWTFGMAVDNNGDPEKEGYRFSGNSPFIDVLKKEPKTSIQ